MASVVDSTGDLSGQPWSVWGELLEKLNGTKEEGLSGDAEAEQLEKASQSDAMKLHREDMWLFDVCPEGDALNLAVCNVCGAVLKRFALGNHLEVRHKADIRKTSVNELAHKVPVSNKAVLSSKTISNSKVKVKPIVPTVNSAKIPSLNVSLPLASTGLASLSQAEKLKEKLRDALRDAPALPPPTIIPPAKSSSTSKEQSTHSKSVPHSKSTSHSSKSGSNSKSGSHSKSVSPSKSSASSKSSSSSSGKSSQSNKIVLPNDTNVTTNSHKSSSSSSKSSAPNKSSSLNKSSSSSSKSSSPSKSSPPTKSSPPSKNSSSSKSSSSPSKSSSPNKSSSPSKSSSSSNKASTSSSNKSSSSISKSSSSNKSAPTSKSVPSSKSVSSSKSLLTPKSLLNPSSTTSSRSLLNTKIVVPSKSSHSSKSQVSLLTNLPSSTPIASFVDNRVENSPKLHSIAPPTIIPPTVYNPPTKKKQPRSDRKIIPIKEREFDPEKHCGVKVLAEDKPCTRSLSCKTHAVSVPWTKEIWPNVTKGRSRGKEHGDSTAPSPTAAANSVHPDTQAAPRNISTTQVPSPITESVVTTPSSKSVNTIVQPSGSIINVNIPKTHTMLLSPPHHSVLIPRYITQMGPIRISQSMVQAATRVTTNTTNTSAPSRSRKPKSLIVQQPVIRAAPVPAPVVYSMPTTVTPTTITVSRPRVLSVESVTPAAMQQQNTQIIIVQGNTREVRSVPPLVWNATLLSLARRLPGTELPTISFPSVVMPYDEDTAGTVPVTSHCQQKLQLTPPTSPRQAINPTLSNRRQLLSRHGICEFLSVVPATSNAPVTQPVKGSVSLLLANHATATMETVITNLSKNAREIGGKFTMPTPTASVVNPPKVAKISLITNNWKPCPPQQVTVTFGNLSSVLSMPIRPSGSSTVVARQHAGQVLPIRILPIPAQNNQMLPIVRDTPAPVKNATKRQYDGPKPTGGKKAKRKAMPLPDVNPAAIISTLLAKKLILETRDRGNNSVPNGFVPAALLQLGFPPEPKPTSSGNNRGLESLLAEMPRESSTLGGITSNAAHQKVVSVSGTVKSVPNNVTAVLPAAPSAPGNGQALQARSVVTLPREPGTESSDTSKQML